MNSCRNLTCLLCTILLIGVTVYGVRFSNGQPNVTAIASLTVTTDDYQYILRQKVIVSGAVSLDGSPASNMLVSIEVMDPNQRAVSYRTVPVGNPDETWVLEISDMYILDLSQNPIDTVKVGNNAYFCVTISNPLLIVIEPVLVTYTIVDASNIPIYASQLYSGSIQPESNITIRKMVNIPKDVTSGKAHLYCDVYNKVPSENGTPYLPSKSAEFYISLTSQGVFVQLPLLTEVHDSSPINGAYELTFRLSQAPEPGDCEVYATGRYSPILKAVNTTSFTVLDVPAPPQASFTYMPLEPYPNETVTFDGSTSTAEGYGDVIIRYEWDFDDGTPKVIKSGNATDPPDPTVTHNFMASGQFIVSLNVTDTEGYWSTTQKPITIKPTNPTANFTWYPLTPCLNRTVIFNATGCLPGWSIPNAAPAPIVDYMWNFGDSPVNYTVQEPTIQHAYIDPGNFTVTLTVTDTEGQQDTINYIIPVENKTSPVYDINGDGKIDIRDVAFVASHFGTYEGGPNWDPAADITSAAGEGIPDGLVDIRDVALVASHFGEFV